MGKTVLEAWIEAAKSAEGLGVKTPWGDGWISRDAPTHYQITIPEKPYEAARVEKMPKLELEKLNHSRSIFRSRLYFRSRPGLVRQMQMKHPIATRLEIEQTATEQQLKQEQAREATEKVRRQVMQSLDEGRGD
jgi:hypothetical protein